MTEFNKILDMYYDYGSRNRTAPNTLYLGHEDRQRVMAEVESFGAYHRTCDPKNPDERYHGMKIIRVLERDYMQVSFVEENT